MALQGQGVFIEFFLLSGSFITDVFWALPDWWMFGRDDDFV